jgi:hypothetical protein
MRACKTVVRWLAAVSGDEKPPAGGVIVQKSGDASK